MSAPAMVLSCLCGSVTLALALQPEFIHACNCTACAKSGAQWGYFAPAEVAVTGATRTYRRQDKPQPGTDFHFCPTCGSTTHFTLAPHMVERFGDTMLGANMLLAQPADLAGIERRFPDGRAWPGEGDFGYTREPEIIA